MPTLVPPPDPRECPVDAAYSAASTAVIGAAKASRQERDPKKIVARTVNAIAVATSTSRSYHALVAAVTATEGFALSCLEDKRNKVPRHIHSQNVANVIHAAVDTAMEAAADAAPASTLPSHICHVCSSRTTSHTASPPS